MPSEISGICKECGKGLVTFYYKSDVTVCCLNSKCAAYKKPVNKTTGGKNGEKGKRKKGISKEL